mgnify:CR=1 FL=1
MKLLLDTCVWGGVKELLLAAGFDVVWVGDSTIDPGDEAVLNLAYKQQRVLITLDKDFGELAVVRGRPHHGIVRLVNVAARRQGLPCTHLLAKYGGELVRGAIVTADDVRVRIRPGSIVESTQS